MMAETPAADVKMGGGLAIMLRNALFAGEKEELVRPERQRKINGKS
jgi:hypothetical protein